MNFWDLELKPLDKLYLNDLNLDGFGFIEMDLKGADFSNSSLVRAYLRSHVDHCQHPFQCRQPQHHCYNR